MPTYFIAIRIPEKIAVQFVGSEAMGKTHLASNAYHITLAHFGAKEPSPECIALLKERMQDVFANDSIGKTLTLIFKNYKRVNVYGDLIEKLYEIVRTVCEETQQHYTQVPEPHMTMSYKIPKHYETDYPVASLLTYTPDHVIIICSQGTPRDPKTDKKLSNHPIYEDWKVLV